MDKLNIETHKCVLCHNAICNKKYKNIDPERIIWMEDTKQLTSMNKKEDHLC